MAQDNCFEENFENRTALRNQYSYYNDKIKEYINFLVPQNASVLEIGCFTGEQLASLNPKKGLGVDFSPSAIETAKRNFPRFNFKVVSPSDLDVGETFDYVVINNVIGFVDDLQKAFFQIKKTCNQNTKIVLVYNSNLWRPVFKIAEFIGLKIRWYEQHWLATKDLENLLYLNDFEIVRKTQQILFPLYIPIISTIFNKILVHLPILRSLALNHIFIVKPKIKARDPKDVSCSVIIPCRNEKGNIEAAITRTPLMGKHTEFIFVEGHSSDGTLDECNRVKEKYKDHDIKVLVQKGRGKGDAVREGFAAATCDVLMILDSDLTTPPEAMNLFFEALVAGKGEFINGTRLVYKMEKEAMQFLNMIANKSFSIILTYLLGQYLKDTLCGTKVLYKSDYLKIADGRSYFGEFDPFGDFDLLFGAAKLNLKIVEIPVHYKARVYGSTQISRFRHGWLLIKMTMFAMRKIKFV